MSDDDLDDIPPEIDFSGGVPNKHAARSLKYGHSVTLIDKDGNDLGTEYFPPPEAQKPFGLKRYQTRALETLDEFLRRAQQVGPKSAFEMMAAEAGRAGLMYHSDFGATPCVCLRLPTGGGKTILASHAISHIATQWLGSEAPVALWLTPSDTITQQTINALKTAGHPYRAALEQRYGTRLKVCDLSEVALVPPPEWGQAAVVIVATIQSFRITETAQRKVYAMSEAFEAHFRSLPPNRLQGLQTVSEADVAGHSFLTAADIGRVKTSLVNWLALHNPIIVVDEAHNARTDLSFKALADVRPACVLELTATPIPKRTNVLVSVSAQELQTEDMIKLPIVLSEHLNGWEQAVFEALQRRKQLEVLAQNEAEYIRPIVLFQAEPQGGEMTVDKLRQHLIEKEHIPAAEIARATGDYKELEGENLMSPKCPIRFVITVEALKEGWDCPFAYVLCSLQTVRSAKDVEQLLGRVLRMPYATPRKQAALSRAYANVVARTFAEAADALADRLVENMGFEALELAAFFAPPQGGLFDPAAPETQPPPALPILQVPFTQAPNLPAAPNVTSITPESGGVVVAVQGLVSEETKVALVAAAPTKKEREALAQRIERHNAAVTGMLAPASRGAGFNALPRLCVNDQGTLDLIESTTAVTQANMDLLAQKVALPSFKLAASSEQYEIFLKDQRVKVAHTSGTQGELDNVPTTQTEHDLVNWLDQQVRTPLVTKAHMQQYLTLLVRNLINETGLPLAGLIRARFQLAQAIERRLEELQAHSVARGFQMMLDTPGAVTASYEHTFRFEPNRYPARPPYYQGRWRFERHYYPLIADLKSEGEEFECARLIDRHPKVRHWVRNLPREPRYSFWLPTSTDYFYPDFVCELTDGRVLVVEYKGAYLDNADTAEKERIGRLWAGTSSGKCLFLMAFKERDGHTLQAQLDNALA
jgi:type III restriction enzyme